MAPYISFDISPEAYARFAELLAPHGITVRDIERSSTIDIQTGGVSSESYKGVFAHGGHEFEYHRDKNVSITEGSDVSTEKCSVTVSLIHHDQQALNSFLWDTLIEVFPQLFEDDHRQTAVRVIARLTPGVYR